MTITEIRKYTKTSSLAILIAIFSLAPLSLPASAAADSCEPPVSSDPGVHRPVGSDASLYTYDCVTGMWVSAHFTYNPSNGVYSPNEPTIYTYNSTSGKYDYSYWVFNAPQGIYLERFASVNQPPAGANVIGAPEPVQTISNTGDGSNNTIDNGGTGGSQTINGTGANSDNSITGTGQNNILSNNNNVLSVANLINQNANTGEAMVVQNTTAGNATSGNAENMATIVNMLQSASNTLGSGNVVTFVSDINGDVTGDLLFDPSILGSTVQAAGSQLPNTNLTVNNSTDASITNDINLISTTGDATVSENTTAGNATSGNAKAIANVVNMINSAVSSGKSFIGTININGNLNGDILLPPDLVDQLIAAKVPTVTITNTGADSNNTVNNAGSNTTNVKNTNDQGITNNIKSNATTGNAKVSENTSAGNATSGNAKNSITAFNLTGSNVVGKNAILVFVNVSGSWVGLIVNAPPGSHAAALGGSISQTGSDSNNNINSAGTNSTNVDNNVKENITNNINLTSKSGDANVTRNTNAGNAKSGDATNAINLLNVENSSLSLSGWFGILFINVFGTWNGSFGVNTSAGDPVYAAAGIGAGSGNPGLFSFVPGGVGAANKTTFGSAYGGGSGSSNNNNSAGAAVLASSSGPTSKQPVAKATAGVQHTNWILISLAGGLFIAYLIGDRAYEFYGTRRSTSDAVIGAVTTTTSR